MAEFVVDVFCFVIFFSLLQFTKLANIWLCPRPASIGEHFGWKNGHIRVSARLWLKQEILGRSDFLIEPRLWLKQEVLLSKRVLDQSKNSWVEVKFYLNRVFGRSKDFWYKACSKILSNSWKVELITQNFRIDSSTQNHSWPSVFLSVKVDEEVIYLSFFFVSICICSFWIIIVGK